MPDRQLISGESQAEDLQFEAGLRPRRLADFTGQTKLKENLGIAIQAARMRGEAMDHVLLYGPPGLGKTTLAAIIGEELEVTFTSTSGPVLQKKLDLTGILSNIRARQVFFIDEIHRLLPDVEEMLYAALEDFRVDILVGAGPGARTHSLPMPKFTAIDATTRQGLVSAPLRGRFGLVLRLDPYNVDELQTIVNRSAGLLAVEIEPGAAEEIARRCRGTPRIANRLLRRVRDYAQVRADGRITQPVAQTALRSSRARRKRLRAAAGARRVSPTGCCGASAITPRYAPMAASRSPWPRPRSDRAGRGGRDCAPLPGHAAYRQPAAAARPRLRPGTRRWPHHAARGPDRAQPARRGPLRPG